ncbi:MAG: AraC family transcriptional regulator, partial [Alphaproteobacteria bacterium]|nr:AraC family transcriptional regulator [Alphaproteobacteria bacterium]
MNTDPLSDILTFLDARCLVTGGFSAGGRWGVHFRAPKAIKFSVVTKGECWLVIDGDAEPRHLLVGDVIFFKGDRSFSMLSDLDVEPGDAETLIGRDGGIAVIGAGDNFINLGGHVALDEHRSALLLDELPPFIRIGGIAKEAAGLQWLLKELVDEGALDRPGSKLSTSYLAQLMFVRVLRAHLAESDIEAVGWLRGLGDSRIAPALRLLHADPQRNWNLHALAKAAGMSRSVFAARFKAV